jgi:hypothetical protein
MEDSAMTEQMKPEIEVLSDYDGYFEALVRRWVDRKTTEFKFKKIQISSGPYRADAVRVYQREGQPTVVLDFYSALRTGFGHLSETDVNAIIEML